MGLRKRWGALMLAAVVIAGGVAFVASRTAPKPGRLLVLATISLPRPPQGKELAVTVVALRVQADGGGWTTVSSPETSVNLPGGYVAPDTASLLQAEVPAGSYKGVELELRTSRASLNVVRTVPFQVVAGQMTPLLFTFRMAAGAPQPEPGAAYGGSSQVTFGLALASNQIQAVPNTEFVNQQGTAVRLSQYRGKVIVLASFLTECQESCPLVAAALLQLQQMLQQRGLSKQVQILEATQDPTDDTPSVLTKYQRYFSLPWPLLTGTTSSINGFWSKLGLPPVQALPWGGPAPTDLFTGQPELYNLAHASVVEVINPQGYIVTVMQSWPTLSYSSIPKTVYHYLDAQGRSQQKSSGTWTPESLFQAITPLLQQQQQIDSFPGTGQAVPGKVAPNFTLEATSGAPVTLASLHGHPVMLDFWASWCSNCRADMRVVAKAVQEYGRQGLRVLLIDDQESSATVRNFLRTVGVTIPSLLDSHGSVAQAYGLPGLPVAVFVEPDGRISSLVLGQLQLFQLQAAVSKLLAA
ncbi:MAG: redoxin domain-containing protein [Candidatus Dormibacteria bacterium]